MGVINGFHITQRDETTTYVTAVSQWEYVNVLVCSETRGISFRLVLINRVRKAATGKRELPIAFRRTA